MKQMKRRTFLKAFAAVAISLVTRGGGGDGVKPSPSEPKLPEPKESAGGGYPVPSKFAKYLKELYNAQREHRTIWTGGGRGSGRTTQMLKYALFSRHEHKNIRIWCATRQQAENIYHMFRGLNLGRYDFSRYTVTVLDTGTRFDFVVPSEHSLPRLNRFTDWVDHFTYELWRVDEIGEWHRRTRWTSENPTRLNGTMAQFSQDGENWVDLEGVPAESVHYKFTSGYTAYKYTNELLEDAQVGLPKGFIELDIKGTYEES